MTGLPTTNDGYDLACPWPSCREAVHLQTQRWRSLDERTDPRSVEHDGETWFVECVNGHIIWTQTDEAAHDGGDVTEPDSPYNHARVVDVIGRLTTALADIPFTERCAWCGARVAVLIGETTAETPDVFPSSIGSQDPACTKCAKERRLIAVRSLVPQTRAQLDAEQAAPA